jgi:hypothetical protein
VIAASKKNWRRVDKNFREEFTHTTMKRGRFLVILSIVLAVVIGGGAITYAAFLYHREQGASVEILGSGFALYYDESLTSPVGDTDILDFNSLRQDTPSDVVDLWGGNVGSDPLYVQVSESGLDSLLALTETGTTINSVPVTYYTPGSLVSPVDTSNPLATAVTATDTTLNFTSACGAQSYTYCRLDNEIIGIPTWPGSGNTLTGVLRGQAGTVAAPHSAGTAWWVANAINAPTGALAAGDSIPFSFQLASDGDVSSLVGEVEDFTIIFEAHSDY